MYASKKLICKKRRFKTEIDALVSISTRMKKNINFEKEKMDGLMWRAYVCGSCGWWHLTKI